MSSRPFILLPLIASGFAACTHAQPAPNTPPIISLAQPALSAAIADPANPRLAITLEDAESPPAQLQLQITHSTNPAVVPLSGLTLNSTGSGTYELSLNPTGIGYTTLTLRATDPSGLFSEKTLPCAASAAAPNPTATRHHYGKADASTALAISATHMLVGDDEDQTIRLYSRDHSGLPLQTFDYTAALGLTDLSGGLPREIDIEASTRVGNRVYWLCSHSNSSSGSLRPNRYRVFATELNTSASANYLTYLSRYDLLRPALLAWGDALGYNFTASAAKGKIPEDAGRDGFNLEGLTTAPNGHTFYLGFRAPLVPLPARNLAIIAPVRNLNELIDGTATTPDLAPPILLDLGGRGIRSIERNANGEYLILAGPSAPATGVAPLDFQLYYWTGNPADAPLAFANDLNPLALQGGSPEGIVEVPAMLRQGETIQLAIDNGDSIWYGDGVIAKELPVPQFKKFRTVRIQLSAFAE